jgi:hypothetical protein
MSDVPQTRPFVLPWKDSDDEVVVNVAIGSLRESLLAWLKTERGVHAETLLCSIGALAGFAAQTAAFGRVEKRDIPFTAGADPKMSTAAFAEYLRTANLMLVANAKSGEAFYFGDLINGYIVPQAINDYSLWNFVAAAAIEAGLSAADLPDYRPMFQFAAQSVGTPEFGIPRVDKKHQPQLAPRAALNLFWPRARFLLTREDGPGPAKGRHVPPRYWPLVIDIVARQCVLLSKSGLDPKIAVALVMESAIAMSKVDPKTVPQVMPAPPNSVTEAPAKT